MQISSKIPVLKSAKTHRTKLLVGVIRLDNIGDHILGSGFLKGLRQNLAEAKIIVFVTKKTAALYLACPYIDRCIVLDSSVAVEAMPELYEWVGKLHLLINPRFARDYYGADTIVRKLAASRSVSFRTDSHQANLCYSETLEPPQGVHVAEYANILLRYLFPEHKQVAPETWTHPLDALEAQKKLRQRGWNENEKLILLSVGASVPYRRWPEDRVIGLFTQLVSSFQCQVMLVGAGAERHQYRRFSAWHHPKLINALGLLSLPQLAACCKLGVLFIGTDSGPKHIAAANALRVVEINHIPASFSPERSAVWPTGKHWTAYAVDQCQVRPAGEFSESQVLSGHSIAAVTEAQVMIEAVRLLQPLQP